MNILTTLILSSILLVSCNILVNPNENNLNLDLGVKNGSSFSVKVNYNKTKNFHTKNSSNGFTGKRSDIKLLRIYLVDNNGTSLVGTNIKHGPYDIDISNTGMLATFFTNVTGTSGTSGTGTLTFSNIGAGTYYVAIAAYRSTTTINNTTNITISSTNITNVTNFGNFAISNTGGDATNGVITIDATVSGGKAIYSLTNNGITSLGVTLNLIDSFGATIDAPATITQGNTTIPATTLQ